METKYQKTTLIRAWQIGSAVDKPAWLIQEQAAHKLLSQPDGTWIVMTKEGPLVGYPGSAIAQNVSGEIYLIDPKVFFNTYTAVSVPEEKWTVG